MAILRVGMNLGLKRRRGDNTGNEMVRERESICRTTGGRGGGRHGVTKVGNYDSALRCRSERRQKLRIGEMKKVFREALVSFQSNVSPSIDKMVGIIARSTDEIE